MTADPPRDSSFDSTRRALLAAAGATGLLPLSRSALAAGGRDGDDSDATDAADADSDDADSEDDSPNADDETPDRDWPMVGFGPTRAFHQYQTTGPSERLRLSWQYGGVRGVPIVADGVAYLEGRRPGNPTDANELHAIDLQTREREWWAEIPGRRFTPPAVADGTVYVVGEDESVFALDADTGDLRWHYPVSEAHYSPPPTVADGRIYVSYDGRLFALTPDGDCEWSRYGDFNSHFPVAVGRGLVYAGVDDLGVAGDPYDCDHRAGLLALDAETGERAWTYLPTEDDSEGDSNDDDPCGSVTIPPVVADGTVYTCFQTDRDKYWDLTALDATTGERRWETQVEGGIFGTIAVADGTVYVPLTQRLTALDADTGKAEWTHRVEIPDHSLTAQRCVSTPTVADGSVYLGTHDGRVRVLNPETGDRYCEYALGNQFDLRRPLTVVDGAVYVTGAYDADQNTEPSDLHLFALAEDGDDAVTADFWMKRSHWEIPGQSDHFRTDYETGFYAGWSRGPIATYEWDLTGDGTVDATGRLVTHTYETVGSKTVTLTVTGETGATDSVSKSFYVTD